jgi:hypothetical protein
MSARSSRRELLILACALVACGKSGPKKPEADPAEVTKLTATMTREVPAFAAVRDCTPDDYKATTPLTFRSLLLLAGKPLQEARPEVEPWTNPPELDAPAVRTLLDGKDKLASRHAAAELLASPGFMIYKIDHVNAPMALGVRELKIGTISGRVIRYEKTGLPACIELFHIQSDPKISDDAIEVSDKAAMDPAVVKILREDHTVQLLKKLPRGTKP